MVSNNEHNEEAEMNREDGGIAGLGMHPLPVARLGGMRREYFERMTDIGTASAAARWIADLLPPWLTWLREPEMKPQDLDDEVQLMLVTGFKLKAMALISEGASSTSRSSMMQPAPAAVSSEVWRISSVWASDASTM